MSTGMHVIAVPGIGPEDVVVGTHGEFEGVVFTGTVDGTILRIAKQGRRIETVTETGGRPLGIEFTPDGMLLVCDADRGLLRVDPGSGEIDDIADSVAGVPMRFCNNGAIGPDGSLWFSDSSRYFGVTDWKSDLVQHTRSGRLLRIDPSGDQSVVLDGLAFANGVAVSAAGDYVVVAETGARTLVRHWLAGPHAGTQDYLAAELPGYPDNISLGSDGHIWVAIASPIDPVLTRLQTLPPLARRLISKIPDPLLPSPQRTIRVQAYDDAGELVHDISMPAAPDFFMVTGVREHEGRVWLGSLIGSAVAVLDR